MLFRAGAPVAENVSNFSEDSARVDQDVEHDAVFIDFPRPFFQNTEILTFSALFEYGFADSLCLGTLHSGVLRRESG